MDIDMQIINDKSDKEILDSLLAEVAKARSEVKCAKQDLDKANNRLSFALVLINALLDRN